MGEKDVKEYIGREEEYEMDQVGAIYISCCN